MVRSIKPCFNLLIKIGAQCHSTYLLSANTRESTTCTLSERRRARVLREHASHKSDLSLNPRPDMICCLSLVASHPFLSSTHFKSLDQEGQVVPNICYKAMCCCEGHGFQAV